MVASMEMEEGVWKEEVATRSVRVPDVSDEEHARGTRDTSG